MFHTLDFHSVLALGTAIAALLTAVCLLLAPMLGGSAATRLLAAGNCCFTAMLALRMVVPAAPPAVAYGAIWSLLIGASALHWLALRELGPDRGGRLHGRAGAVAASVAALWVATFASATPDAAAMVTALATCACYGAALRAAFTLRGRAFALPRRTLALGFGASVAFAALHVAQRAGELARGDAVMSSTAFTCFGAVLLFCTINAGILVLMYMQLAQRVAALAQTDALTVRQFMRRDDLLVRMGGEAFCLLLPGLDAEAARGVAERIRSEFEAR